MKVLPKKRLEFLSEIFNKEDPHNGGFKKRSQTPDNILILYGCIQKCRIERKKIYVAFVDFRRAFDTVNRYMFYKIFKSGFCGKLINLIKDMYSKTSARVKVTGDLSEYRYLYNEIGVNQGGSGGWADDMIFLSNTKKGLQNHLDKLYQYCSRWHLIVNTMKTKVPKGEGDSFYTIKKT